MRARPCAYLSSLLSTSQSSISRFDLRLSPHVFVCFAGSFPPFLYFFRWPSTFVSLQQLYGNTQLYAGNSREEGRLTSLTNGCWAAEGYTEQEVHSKLMRDKARRGEMKDEQRSRSKRSNKEMIEENWQSGRGVIKRWKKGRKDVETKGWNWEVMKKGKSNW